MALSRLTTGKGSENVMTVLGAVVFGGLLGLAVLWLLLTAPENEVDNAWDHSQAPQRSLGSSPCAATHSPQK